MTRNLSVPGSKISEYSEYSEASLPRSERLELLGVVSEASEQVQKLHSQYGPPAFKSVPHVFALTDRLGLPATNETVHVLDSTVADLSILNQDTRMVPRHCACPYRPITAPSFEVEA